MPGPSKLFNAIVVSAFALAGVTVGCGVSPSEDHSTQAQHAHPGTQHAGEADAAHDAGEPDAGLDGGDGGWPTTK